MHLIAPLASGIVGAANGTATLRRRGTGTPATWYSTFESDGVSTATVSLDANGGAAVYVNEYVDVAVYSSDGALVRTFTAGDAATNVEVRSSAFTGTDYTTSVSGAQKPIDLASVLDLWLTSAGTTDFKVMVNGVATLLKNAWQGPIFYTVKDAQYGAKGDGTTNDRTAIQAAFDAAHAAGGGVVYFPPGTYRITSALTWYNDISLMGAGSQVSRISMDHASENHLTASGASNRKTYVIGLDFTHAQACSGAIAYDNSLARAHAFIECNLGISTLTTGLPISMSTTGSRADLWGCKVQTKNNGIHIRNGSVSGCKFVLGAVSSGTQKMVHIVDFGFVESCEFDVSLASGTAAPTVVYFGTGAVGSCAASYFNLGGSGGTILGVHADGTAEVQVSGCKFTSGGSLSTFTCVTFTAGKGSVAGCSFPTLGSASAGTGISIGTNTCEVSESGNEWTDGASLKAKPGITPYSYSLSAGVFGQLQLASRNGFRDTATQSGGGTKTLSADQYGHVALTVSDNTGFTLQLNTAPVGAFFTVDILASGGAGSGAIAWGANIYGNPGGGFSIATTKHRVYLFRSALVGAAIVWVLCATTFGDM